MDKWQEHPHVVLDWKYWCGDKGGLYDVVADAPGPPACAGCGAFLTVTTPEEPSQPTETEAGLA